MTAVPKSRKPLRAIDKLTQVQADTVGAWFSTHQAALAMAARAAGRRGCAITGLVYEVAAVRVRLRTLAELSPSEAIRLAVKREDEDYIVRRPRGEERPVVVDLDETVDTKSDADPLGVLIAAEADHEREDETGDHDDRMSWTAVRAAAGHQPVAAPEVLRHSRSRARRRWRVRARYLREAGQGDLPGFGLGGVP